VRRQPCASWGAKSRHPTSLECPFDVMISAARYSGEPHRVQVRAVGSSKLRICGHTQWAVDGQWPHAAPEGRSGHGALDTTGTRALWALCAP
jgi:hypothetical protein